MTLSDSELALVQNIKETVNSLEIRMERNFESLQNQLLRIHTPQSCEEASALRTDVRDLRDQQKKWIGGLAVLAGIGGLLIAFKDSIVDIFRR